MLKTRLDVNLFNEDIKSLFNYSYQNKMHVMLLCTTLFILFVCHYYLFNIYKKYSND